MAAHADQGDTPQGMVGVPIATRVEAVTIGPPRGGGQRGHPTRPREGGLTAQPPWVVSSGHQQLPGAVQADAGRARQARASALVVWERRNWLRNSSRAA